MIWRKTGVILLVLSAVFSVAALVWENFPQPRTAFYRLYREQGRKATLDTLSGYQRESSKRFELYFTEPDENVTGLVLETAEEVYATVVSELGFRPAGPIPIILYPNRDELRQAFGWGNGESALGVYWHGTIRLLSPNVWIQQQTSSKQRKAFRKLNPIAHELSHYVLDYMTDGNYPRWFTEGLAQRIEFRTTGFLWIEPSSSLRQELYSLEDLNRFDQLTNQPLAYRQSYLLVDYMAQTYGAENLTRAIQLMADGTPFDRVVQKVYQKSMEQIYHDWIRWVNVHLDQLEEER